MAVLWELKELELWWELKELELWWELKELVPGLEYHCSCEEKQYTGQKLNGWITNTKRSAAAGRFAS